MSQPEYGLTTSERNITYVNTFHGMFTIKASPGEEGAVQRKNKNGDVVWEFQHDTIFGFLFDITVKDSDYGKQWKLFIDAKTKKYCLNLKCTSGLARTIMYRLPNADFSKPIQLDIFISEGFARISLKQDGKPVPRYFDPPNCEKGCPDRVELGPNDEGIMQYNSADQNNFLYKYINEHILPKLPKVSEIAMEDTGDDEGDALDEYINEKEQQKSQESTANQPSNPDVFKSGDNPKDDLPF